MKAADAVARAFDRIAADGRDGIWITLAERRRADVAAAAVDECVAAGATLPLAGTTLAVKDNIDVAGLPTTAGCPAYSYVPDVDAAAVGALVAAGAVVVGKTNLDQFATGLVGVRSPYGACPNSHWPALVAGGSSSGSAVAVASDLVDLALGTDTAGSGRVPAACNGIVGLKPTRGRIACTGVVPACRSLDCVSVFARTVELAALAAGLATGPDPDDPWSRCRPQPGPTATAPDMVRIGVPAIETLTFDGDRDGPGRFRRALERVAGAGYDLRPIDLTPFRDAGDLLYGGSFVAERYEAVGAFVDAHRTTPGSGIDPVVGGIIGASAELAAWSVFRDLTELARLRALTAPTWSTVDVLVVPTVPRVPTTAEVRREPIAVNTMLGTYTNFVNLLDLSALTIPLDDATTDHPPSSITLIAPAWCDDALVSAARRVLAAPAATSGDEPRT